MGHRQKSVGKFVVLMLFALVLVLVGLGTWYVNDYYRADAMALAEASDVDGAADGVRVRTLEGGALAFVPDAPRAGFVFYPGAKVQPEAYAPLLTRIAKQGVACILVKPLFNIAILDMNCADGTMEQLPGVRTWAIGGHSMGGVAAGAYAAEHEGAFACLAFIASYPTCDLSESSSTSVSVVGDRDSVLNHQNYEQARSKLPTQSNEVVIAGGNHCYFGNYGEQAGDAAAGISREEQQQRCADAIASLVLSER